VSWRFLLVGSVVANIPEEALEYEQLIFKCEMNIKIRD
jgi:hypothetical protein